MTSVGAKLAVMGNEIWRVADGHLVEHWRRFEDIELLQQLGVCQIRRRRTDDIGRPRNREDPRMMLMPLRIAHL
jgi:hypothetical protein